MPPISLILSTANWYPSRVYSPSLAVLPVIEIAAPNTIVSAARAVMAPSRSPTAENSVLLIESLLSANGWLEQTIFPVATANPDRKEVGDERWSGDSALHRSVESGGDPRPSSRRPRGGRSRPRLEPERPDRLYRVRTRLCPVHAK